MSTLPLTLQHMAGSWRPFKTGVSLAVTVALFYAACTLVWVVAPGPFLGFMSSLFHGMDFTPLLKSAAFSWSGFIAALLVMAVWAFLGGAFFSWLHHKLSS